MYHPPVSPSEDGWDVDDFEFIELMNVGTAAIDLTGVQLVDGIKFDFADDAVPLLSPGAMVLVVAGTGSPSSAGTGHRYHQRSPANTAATWPTAARRSS